MRLGAHKSTKSRDTRDLVPRRSPVWPRSRKKKGREGKGKTLTSGARLAVERREGGERGLACSAGPGWAVRWGIGCLAADYGHVVASSIFIFFSVFFSKKLFPNKILNANKFKPEANNTK